MLLPKTAIRQRPAPHRVPRHRTSRGTPPVQRPGFPPPPPPAPSGDQHVQLGGSLVALMEQEDAIARICTRASDGEGKPLAVCSANLDHIRHFGAGSRWAGVLDQPPGLEWMTLIDGAPLAAQAARMTGHAWPRLAGSDLMGPLLDEFERRGLRVGFLGGSPGAQEQLRRRLSEERPGLVTAGWWSPERPVLTDRDASLQLAADVAARHIDVLVVGLGKPRQELWIAEYGELTGARVLLAFGAAVDFLAGRIRRAPGWVSSHGLEWAWRLMLEPRRLVRRYIVEGPGAYVTLRTHSTASVETAAAPRPASEGDVPGTASGTEPGRFVPATDTADVAVIVVTYNNAEDIDGLVAGLRGETAGQTIKVVVADNSPDNRTLDELRKHTDVIAVRTGGNLGYAGGINRAMQAAGPARSYLILNPDLRVEAGAVGALRRRMAASGAGVVVPVLLDDDGSVYPSLRREPGILRALGDGVCGGRLQGRPGWLSEMDFAAESYCHAHVVEWATGAALLIDARAVGEVGDWDERFFLYSEETDFCRRVREAGFAVWFEPLARMWHERGGSGSSPQLTALMAVNRVRYAAKYFGRGSVGVFASVVLAAEVVRSADPGHREAVWSLLRPVRRRALPRAVPYGATLPVVPPPVGAVIIPAHNEESVIGRTLDSLVEVVGWGTVEVVVACNGCTDRTEEIVSGYRGVRCLHVGAASKPAALNAGDAAVGLWPRLYLDADIEVSAGAVRQTLVSLADGPLLAARPAFRYDTRGASWLVRSYYRARCRVPSTSRALWGAGVYALSRSGHERLGVFPELSGDDYLVDNLFSECEKAVLAGGDAVVVRTPRTRGALVAVLRRSYRGNAEQDSAKGGSSSLRTLREVVLSIRGPFSAVDAAVYLAFAAAGRRRSFRRGGPEAEPVWERDDSSR